MASQGTAQRRMGAMIPIADPKSEALPPPDPVTPRWTIWLAPCLSAGMLYMSFFPVAWGWLAWVALVPWLCLVRANPRPRRLYLAAWLGGLLFFWPALSWMRVADSRMYITWAILATYCSVYFPLVLYWVRLLDRRTRLPLVLTFPLVWVASEYLRYGFAGSFISILTGSHLHDYPGGFAWYFLGHTQHDVLELIQIVDLTGVYGVCFLIAAVNAFLFEILFSRAWFRRIVLGTGVAPREGKFSLLIQGLCLSVSLLSVLGYGVWRLGQNTQSPGPRLALLQGSVDQRIKSMTSAPDGEARDEACEKLFRHYASLADIASREKVDLIVWPETSLPDRWVEIAPRNPTPITQDLAHYLTARWKNPLLLGMNTVELGEDGKRRSYNSAILLDRNGRRLGRYDKIHRVPFGEYIPMRSLMPWLNRLSPYDWEYAVAPGEDFTRFALPGAERSNEWRFGVVICYEDSDPGMSLPYAGADGGPLVDFLLNISNDGWFDGTSEHDQHLALCRFRAIECRRSIARAVNMGISAVIDSNGRVLAPEWTRKADVNRWEVPPRPADLSLSAWKEYKKVAGVLLATIPIDTRTSFYARSGDWFAAGCSGFLLLSLLGLHLHRRFRGSPG